MLGLGSSITRRDAPDDRELYSISFDGSNDYVTLGDVLDLGTDDFSISFWVKLADVTSKQLISKYEDNDNQILIYFSNEKIVAYAAGGGNIVCNHVEPPGGDMTALQNTWVHICVSWDRSGDGAVYINGATDTYGVALHDLTNDSQTLSNSGSWYFMRHSSSYTAGEMTEVAMWNVALSPAEITNIYNGGVPWDLNGHSQSSALLGYWRMNDGTGTVATDSSGNGNNGTLTNGPTWSTDTPDD